MGTSRKDKIMKKKDLFINALSTLFYSWGGDTPPEAFWAGNELLEWYEAEYGVKLGIEFDELYKNDSDKFDDVIDAIRKN